MNRERLVLGDVEQPTADRVDELVRELVAARERRALSQRRLSALLGLTEIVVSKWECKLDTPSTEHFVRWGAFLGYELVLVDPADKPIVDRPDVLPQEPFEHYEVRRIALALKAARQDAGFTQKALGAELAVSKRTVWLWESSRRGPRLKHLLAWADRLGCRIVLEPQRLGSAT